MTYIYFFKDLRVNLLLGYTVEKNVAKSYYEYLRGKSNLDVVVIVKKVSDELYDDFVDSYQDYEILSIFEYESYYDEALYLPFFEMDIFWALHKKLSEEVSGKIYSLKEAIRYLKGDFGDFECLLEHICHTYMKEYDGCETYLLLDLEEVYEKYMFDKRYDRRKKE